MQNDVSRNSLLYLLKQKGNNMELTQEKTNLIITLGADAGYRYQHVAIIDIGGRFLDNLAQKWEVVKSLSSQSDLVELIFESDNGSLIKTRDNTELYFPGWEDMVSEEKWCYLKATEDELNHVIEEHDDSGDKIELKIKVNGFFCFQFCPEVGDGDYQYYTSQWIRIDTLLANNGDELPEKIYPGRSPYF